MSEIKVGDKINPSGFVMCVHDKKLVPDCYRFFDNNKIVGIVKYIVGNQIQLKTLSYGLEDFTVLAHRKQCRRLVKIKKCNACHGNKYIPPVYDSKYDPLSANYNPGYFEDQPKGSICYKCNGSGKMPTPNPCA